MRNAELYEQDFYLWTQKQVALLREGKWHELDCEHLMEEIEDLGRSARKELRSYLEGLVLHLLKWRYQPSHRGVSWRLSIRNARRRIGIILSDSPSLRPTLPGLVAEEFLAARIDAIDETGLPTGAFPATCPFTLSQLLDTDFWPQVDAD